MEETDTVGEGASQGAEVNGRFGLPEMRSWSGMQGTNFVKCPGAVGDWSYH
jgi:hypothetical protein